MRLLAFELATEACSVALSIDGQVRERFEIAPRRHAELALPWAEQLLADAGIAKSQLDAIAVGRGPGAFTGVRLAIAIAQGIALALDRPVVPVSTLAALAMQAVAAPAAGDDCSDRHVLAAIDARMSEVYVGRFQLRGGDAIALGGEAILAPDSVVLDGHVADEASAGRRREAAGSATCWYGVGTGFGALDASLQRRLVGQLITVDAHALPRAAAIAGLAELAYARGEAVDAALVEPAYLRNNVALTMAEQQQLRDSRS